MIYRRMMDGYSLLVAIILLLTMMSTHHQAFSLHHHHHHHHQHPQHHHQSDVSPSGELHAMGDDGVDRIRGVLLANVTHNEDTSGRSCRLCALAAYMAVLVDKAVDDGDDGVGVSGPSGCVGLHVTYLGWMRSDATKATGYVALALFYDWRRRQQRTAVVIAFRSGASVLGSYANPLVTSTSVDVKTSFGYKCKSCGCVDRRVHEQYFHLREKLWHLLEKAKRHLVDEFMIIGAGMGGAMATLCAMDMGVNAWTEEFNGRRPKLITFGASRVGDGAFTRKLRALVRPRFAFPILMTDSDYHVDPIYDLPNTATKVNLTHTYKYMRIVSDKYDFSSNAFSTSEHYAWALAHQPNPFIFGMDYCRDHHDDDDSDDDGGGGRLRGWQRRRQQRGPREVVHRNQGG